MIKAPQASSSSAPEATPSTPPRFALSAVVTSPTKHKVLTTLPLADFLEKLHVGPTIQHFAKKIHEGLSWIYKNVTMRNPEEGTDYFFVHIAATVIYEGKKHTFIKGKCHPKNAASILNIIQPILKTITGVLERYNLKPEERETLLLVKNIYVVSINAIYEALQAFNETRPDLIHELLTTDRVDVLAYRSIPLTVEESAALLKIFPQEEGTPKRKTAETKSSVAVLNGDKRKSRRLFQNEPPHDETSAAAAAALPASAVMQVPFPEDSAHTFSTVPLRDSLSSLFNRSQTMSWMFDAQSTPLENDEPDFNAQDVDNQSDPGSDPESDSELPPPVRGRSRFF